MPSLPEHRSIRPVNQGGQSGHYLRSVPAPLINLRYSRQRPMAVFRRAANGLREIFLKQRSRAARLRARATRSQQWYATAGQDPDFLAEIADVDRGFDAASSDGLDCANPR